MRGAWIEICATSLLPVKPLGSLPVRGAWIEITKKPTSTDELGVAPRAGSVD